MRSEIEFTNAVGEALDKIVGELAPSGVWMLCDENTARCVVPLLQDSSASAKDAHIISIPAGEKHKNLETVTDIWKRLTHEGATRRSLMVNVGGGVVCDLGGFAASTFKRGIPFVNIPTTLLAAVDASVGGKTGFDFEGLKNEIGTFCNAYNVIVSSCFFSTLPAVELKSGYAEMLKHALLTSEAAVARCLLCNPADIPQGEMLEMLRDSVAVKLRIVEDDPKENGLRKALNLGHTAGHALESLALRKGSPILHGYAVAHGLVTALVLSHLELGFPSGLLQKVGAYVREEYGSSIIGCNDYDELLEFMSHDKKVVAQSVGKVPFTLLRDAGEVEVGEEVAYEEIRTAIDITRDILG